MLPLRSFFPFLRSHDQPLLGIQPVDALDVDLRARALEQHSQPSVAVTYTAAGQLSQTDRRPPAGCDGPGSDRPPDASAWRSRHASAAARSGQAPHTSYPSAISSSFLITEVPSVLADI